MEYIKCHLCSKKVENYLVCTFCGKYICEDHKQSLTVSKAYKISVCPKCYNTYIDEVKKEKKIDDFSRG